MEVSLSAIDLENPRVMMSNFSLGSRLLPLSQFRLTSYDQRYAQGRARPFGYFRCFSLV